MIVPSIPLKEEPSVRVLHILDDLKPSGAEVMLRSAWSHWNMEGIKGDILSTGATVGAYADTLERTGFHIYHVPFSAFYKFLPSLYRFFKDHRYSAIHIHAERANFWYALFAYLAGNRRLIRTVHNVFRFQKGLRIERYVQRWFMRTILGVEMVAIGQSVKENERSNFSNPSILVPNWFDSTKFKPPCGTEKVAARRALGISNGVTIFTSVGRCWSFKNHSAIIEALAKLPSGTDVVYLHVGPELDGYPERKLAKARGVCDRVRFLGAVMDVLPILHASDAYLMPSHHEGFSIAAIEAMGAGLPAILADVPGLRDFRGICKGVHWVEPTSESIAEAMVDFVNSATFVREEIGRELSKNVHNYLSIENGAGAYARLYKGLQLLAQV